MLKCYGRLLTYSVTLENALPNNKFSFEFKFLTRRIFSYFFIILLKELFTYLKKYNFIPTIKAHMVHISKAIAVLTYYRGCFTFMVFSITNVSLKGGKKSYFMLYSC